MFSVQYGSLEAIWRSFDDSKLKSDNAIDTASQQTYKKIYHMPKVIGH